jgi:hypothetical protein
VADPEAAVEVGPGADLGLRVGTFGLGAGLHEQVLGLHFKGISVCLRKVPST